ncbi:MAG: hypothetical protein NTV31_00360 [Bacteroidia bacterium]|nr:hypothetical protein [Bacteroidia bacterium]
MHKAIIKGYPGVLIPSYPERLKLKIFLAKAIYPPLSGDTRATAVNKNIDSLNTMAIITR